MEHVKVPSQAPKPSSGTLLLTTMSNNESPTFPLALIFSPFAKLNVTSTLEENISYLQKCLVLLTVTQVGSARKFRNLISPRRIYGMIGLYNFLSIKEK